MDSKERGVVKGKYLSNQKTSVAALLFISNCGFEFSGFILISLLCFCSGYLQNSHSSTMVFYFIGILIIYMPR